MFYEKKKYIYIYIYIIIIIYLFDLFWIDKIYIFKGIGIDFDILNKIFIYYIYIYKYNIFYIFDIIYVDINLKNIKEIEYFILSIILRN